MDFPLTIPRMVLPRAEGLFAARPVDSQVGERLHRSTWGAVADRARRLGGALAELGIGPGDRVATFAWNSYRHLEAYLAVPSMGAVLHTLNVRLFPDQVAYIVAHAQDRVVLVDRSLLTAWRAVEPRLTIEHPTVIVMEDDPDGSLDGGALAYEPTIGAAEPLAWPELDERTAAAMCYTSGTTGDPKGVVYSHRSTVLHSLAVGLADGLGLSASDRVLVVVPMFHANAWGLPYAAALVGASLILPGRDLSPAALCGLIERERPTFAAGVPTIWLGILEHYRIHRPDLSSLRTTVVGGSAVAPALMAAFEDELGVPILHAWGMTETSPIGSTAHLPAELGRNSDPLVRRSYLCSQGRAVSGVEMELLDGAGQPVPHDGEAMGEICVRGPWIASQYYGDDQPGEKFAGGWLHTGDVATIDLYGYVRITDRTKDLVKSGGEWISSVELEGLLMSHPDVLEAAVIAVPDQRWTERPLACVVPRPHAQDRLRAEDLIEYLRPQVARWWLPDGVVFIDAVPKTSVGKFDKKVLRARFPAMPAGARSSVSPQQRAQG
ncbi:MAG TPA: long-chain fatty acid--CoA ligase [Candidatus Dormibacteraeota bacterium]